MHLKSKEME